MQTFEFCDLRAKAADEVADNMTDDSGWQATSKQPGHTALKTTKRHRIRPRAEVCATK